MNERWPVLLMVRQLDFGGSERQCAVTAMALDRSRFEPYVGVFREDGFRVREVERAGIPLVRFDVRGFGSPSLLKAASQMRRFIRQHQIRLVHTFDVPANLFGVPSAWAAQGPRVLSSARANRALTPGLRRRALQLTDRLADGIVVNCEAMREHLIRDEGVARGKTYLCYNGIDVETFHSRRPEQRPEEFTDAQLVVGVVCGLRVEKGLDTLVSAYARVAAARAGMRLVFVGSGVCLSDLQAQARSLGIESQTIFIPARPDVADLLRGIDVFVLPSRSEALSNSLMEAMSCGCCAIASNTGGNPELVQDGRTGLLFSPGDVDGLAVQLRRVIEDAALRARLAGDASRYIRMDFSQEASGARMQEIYTMFLSG